MAATLALEIYFKIFIFYYAIYKIILIFAASEKVGVLIYANATIINGYSNIERSEIDSRSANINGFFIRFKSFYNNRISLNNYIIKVKVQ